MTPHPNAVLRLFWSNAQSRALPRTRREIVVAIKGNPDNVLEAIRILEAQGLIKGEKSRRQSQDAELACYDITPEGLAALQDLAKLAGETVRQSVAQMARAR